MAKQWLQLAAVSRPGPRIQTGLKPTNTELRASLDNLASRDEGKALRPRSPNHDCFDDGADDLFSRLPLDNKVGAHTAAIFRYIDDEIGGREGPEGSRSVDVVFKLGPGMVIVADTGYVDRARRVDIVEGQS